MRWSQFQKGFSRPHARDCFIWAKGDQNSKWKESFNISENICFPSLIFQGISNHDLCVYWVLEVTILTIEWSLVLHWAILDHNFLPKQICKAVKRSEVVLKKYVFCDLPEKSIKTNLSLFKENKRKHFWNNEMHCACSLWSRKILCKRHLPKVYHYAMSLLYTEL